MDKSTSPKKYTGISSIQSHEEFETYAREEAEKLREFVKKLDNRMHNDAITDDIITDENGEAYGCFYTSGSGAIFFIEPTAAAEIIHIGKEGLARWLSQHIPGLTEGQASVILNEVRELGSEKNIYKYDLVFGGSRVRGDYKSDSVLDLGLTVNEKYKTEVSTVSTSQNNKFATLLKKAVEKSATKYNEEFEGEIKEGKKIPYLKVHDLVIYPGFKSRQVEKVEKGEDPFHRIAHRPQSSRAHGIAIPSGTITVNVSENTITYAKSKIVDFPPDIY